MTSGNSIIKVIRKNRTRFYFIIAFLKKILLTK